MLVLALQPTPPRPPIPDPKISMNTTANDGVALVTGGTGLLGSHIAEQLRAKNQRVRAICRAGSDTTFLRKIGAEIVPGDLDDRAELRRACEGVDAVYHAAARVGDWGPWADFVRVTIDGTRNLLEAASAANVRRFLHISSVSVYGHVNGDGKVFDETAPVGVNVHRWSYYTRAKVEAEKIAWDAHRAGKVRLTVVRPAWLYGPRDRATLPRLIENMRRGKVKIVGDGNNRLNVVHAGNVAEGAILAANCERSIGEAYNASHDGVLTQRRYFDLVADAIGASRPAKSVPYSMAYRAAFALETFGHLLKTKKPPFITRYAIWLMGRRCFFECQKLKDHTGWRSRIGYEDGIREATEEYISRDSKQNPRIEQREAVGAAS